jgi:alpha-beta hydrolase superfamily lysophospholipase
VRAIAKRRSLAGRARTALIAALIGGSAAAAATAATTAAPPPASAQTAATPPFAVGVRLLKLVDRSRTMRLPGGRSVPRSFEAVVRYPALGAPGPSDVAGAPAARAPAPFPLVVFAHGFAVTPGIYARLLHSWAQSGYVVAAPVFPLTSAGAPGGPNESDLVNQPADISYAITRLLAASASPAGPFAGLLDPSHVAVAGQSDGGVTALLAAYGRRLRDPRIGAAVVLSGAEWSGVGGYDFSRARAPLLAVQGTADTVNEPRFTYAFFRAAHQPKFLLRLLGAEHLPPYTREQPQLSIVERVSTAFLDAYLKRSPGELAQMPALGDVSGTALLSAAP